MEPSTVLGLTFVLGILGIGATFTTFFVKQGMDIKSQLGFINSEIKRLCDEIKSLKDSRDKFHPRT